MPTNVVELLRRMAGENASDLFLTEGRRPAWRVYGDLKNIDDPKLFREDFDSFINENLPPGTLDRLEEARDLDRGLSVGDDERYRLNLFFQMGKASMVARRVPMGTLEFDDLGLPESIAKLALKKRGLLLITGSTGSGKSSTMAAILHRINTTSERHIVTIEDPIEFIHQDDRSRITQREVGNDTLDFGTALKHVVRQSPDVIFIGEMRDFDTISTAISAAMTGHLVVSTMHTVDPMQTLERIVNFFPEHLRDQVAMDFSLSLIGIISQRLVHKKDEEGLVPAFEILTGTPLAAREIADRQYETIPEIIKSSMADGMITFSRSLADLVAQEQISIEAAANAATHRDEFLLTIQGMETGIDTLRGRDQGKVNKRLNMKSLLKAAIKLKASDLILTHGSAPLLRIDGQLSELDIPKLTGDTTRRLIFSVLNPSQRILFESQKEIDFALSVSNLLKGEDDTSELRGHRFRVNGFYQKGNVAGALRVIPQEVPTPRELNLPNQVMSFANRRSGLILVTGPTGHGKSTTLACLLDQINNNRSCHVITVEDPIEYVHSNRKAIIEQREVHADTISFANALKYVLRQDPDVIMIGEMRDPETIGAALTAAETGHLVFATLHTNDCAQTVDRIIDSFPPYQQNQVRTQLASSLTAVLAQRLLPRADGNGRIAAFEIMVATPAIRTLIRDNRTHQIVSTLETSSKDGMVTMQKAADRLYKEALITQDTYRSLI